MPSSLDNDSQPSTTTKDVDLPITTQTISPVGYISAIALNVATSIFLAVVSRYDILFPINDSKGVHTISNGTRTGYTASITLLATLLSAFSVGQIKQLWLKRNAALGSQGISTKLREYNATLIGLSSISEKLRVWEISLVLIISGLGTTAVVTGLTPSTITHSSPTVGRLGQNLDLSSGWPGSPVCFQLDSGSPSRADWSWRLGNGSFLSVVQDPALRHCASERVLKYMSSKSESTLSMIVLMVAGVAVDKSALGLPYSQWKDGRVLGNFDDIFGTGTLEHESSSFHWATQCLPVLTRNPVRCRQSVTCEVNQNSSYVTFYANSTGCSLILPITKSPNESIADERAGVACSGSRSPGKTTLLFGAVGNNSAQNLYDYMHMDYSANYTPFDNLENMDNTAEVRKARTERNNVTEFFRSHYPNGYGVTCDIDVEPSIGFRLATLTSVDAQAGGWDHSSRLSIQAGKSCEPILEKGGRIQDLQSYLRKDETLAAGAGAAASLLNGTEANLTTLMESINQNWSPGKTAFFDDSTSAFEDNLGVASALAIGMHWGSTYVDQTYNFTNGKLARARTRVGSKDAKAIFCILPSVFTAIILAFLAFDEYRRSGLEKNDVVGGQIMTPSL